MKSPQANIHPNARVADDAIIEPFATIGDNVEIGSGTWIGPGAVIMSGARIGKNCRIFPGAVISAIPQDLKYAGEITTVEIGNNTTHQTLYLRAKAAKERVDLKEASNPWRPRPFRKL